MTKISCWNVNSVRVRLPHLLQYIQDESPDVILLQEIKCLDKDFPYDAFEDAGYNVVCHGQKTFNGVAILSKGPIEDVCTEITNFPDSHARYIEAVTTINKNVYRVASVYVPNGESVDSEKYQYKQAFFDALTAHVQNICQNGEAFAIGGDFNVASQNIDVSNPTVMQRDIGFHYIERAKLHKFENLPIYDSYRVLNPSIQQFSWWNYRANCFANNVGMRIDYIYLSAAAADALEEAGVHQYVRGKERTSDHAPVYCVLNELKHFK